MSSDKISIIITILNGAKWIEQCFQSIIRQTAVLHHQQQQQQQQQQERQTEINKPAVATAVNEEEEEKISTVCKLQSNNPIHTSIEVCAFNDCSADETSQILEVWQRKFEKFQISMQIIRNESGGVKGVGYGRNRAIAKATGNYLCFQDIDDEMLPERLELQCALAREYKNALIGSQFTRAPSNSTCRFTRWANEINADKLDVQIYTSNGPTVIMPTWFCHRQVYDRIPGGFSELGHGTPEDLIFFYEHLDRGGQILRVNACLLNYRYHAGATTFSIAAETIWQIRLKHLIGNVLNEKPWNEGFSIWNAGKQGRKFFRDLPLSLKEKVCAFCDVDKNKIGNFYNYYDDEQRKVTHCVPIVHFKEAKKPLLICMKLDLTAGAFEENLQSLNLKESSDYVLFT